MRFTGKDNEINIAHRRRPQAGIHRLALGADEEPSRLIVPFKRPVYERVVKEFAKFAGKLDAHSNKSPAMRGLLI